MSAAATALPRAPRRGPFAELVSREPTLAWFGLLMLAAMVPAAIAAGVDERTLREANIWIKPLKFLFSVGVFAWTTAWFVGLLPEARRRAWPVRIVVATVVACGGFEIAYIALQAALGQGSHYNVGDPLHAALYGLMAVAAIALTATQGVLAVEVARHGTAARGTAWRDALVVGLMLSAVLGIVSGMMLGGRQPPSGGLPVIGWSAAGDLRPAHFVGLHAHQLLPLAGWALHRLWPGPARGARAAFAVLAGAYVAGWVVLMAAGLSR
ncbi:MAG: hypothetical protein WCK28_22860 [Burkholderiales bacterium]|jgi:hypothetical protein